MIECPSLVADCDKISISACDTLCDMCKLSCNRCDTTTVEPTTGYETTTFVPFNVINKPFARAATFDDDEFAVDVGGETTLLVGSSTLTNCQKAKIEEPSTKCDKNGRFEPMQCLPVEAKGGNSGPVLKILTLRYILF